MVQSLPPITEEKYDCAISYYAMAIDQLLMMQYRLHARKKVAWIHCQCQHKKIDAEYEAFHIAFGNVDKIFCVSQGCRNSFLKVYPQYSKKTEVVYNQIDAEHIRTLAGDGFCEKDDTIKLLTVGRLSLEKGQHFIPKIARMLIDAGFDIKWDIIGEGALREKIEQDIVYLNVDSNVQILGAIENPYPYVQACTIYVQPSLREAFCTSTLEAKILGKPVVATDVDGMREQFEDGVNGILVNDITPEGIFNGIRRLIMDNSLRETITESLTEEKFSFTEELNKLYHLME